MANEMNVFINVDSFKSKKVKSLVYKSLQTRFCVIHCLLGSCAGLDWNPPVVNGNDWIYLRCIWSHSSNLEFGKAKP